MKRVAVIGGGVAGMQTALRLAEQGIEPVIIEKEAELGGKLRGFPVIQQERMIWRLRGHRIQVLC